MVRSYAVPTVVRFINPKRIILFPEIGDMEDAASSMAPEMDLNEVLSE